MTGGLASPPESRYNSPIFPFGPTSAFQRGNFSLPQCVDPRDLHNKVELSSPASEVKKPVEDDEDDEDARMADVPSRESSLHPRDDDGELAEDDASMADVESGKPPLDMQEDEEAKSDDPLGPLSDLEDEDDEANDENGLDISQSSDVMMVDEGPFSESKGAEEGDEEEGRHPINAKIAR